MLFKIGERRIGKLTYCLVPHRLSENKVNLSYFVWNKKTIISNCNTIVNSSKLDNTNETIEIPKIIAKIKLSGCYSPFLIRNIEIRDTVKVIMGIHQGTIGEVVSIEMKSYGQIYYVQFPSKCVCPFTEMEIEKIEVRGQMKFFT